MDIFAMNNYELVYPMFAMVVLTCVVLGVMFRTRVQSVVSGDISISYYKTYRDGKEPDKAIQLSRHFANIFEVPTLFYIVCLVAMITLQSAPIFQLLAWAYVLLRVVHAYIHIGRNKVMHRMRVYFFSWVVLMLMWMYVLIGILLAG
jgi:hypothetical protein